MTHMQSFLKELEQEAQTTRKMLALVPADKYDWAPHEKSMTLKRLATHVAELPGWVGMTLNTSELDFSANPYTAEKIEGNNDLMNYFERNVAEGIEELKKAREEQLADNWTLRDGDQIYSVSSKHDVLRMTYSQIIHHRAQLGVYLRLLNIPLPGSYGPTADDMSF